LSPLLFGPMSSASTVPRGPRPHQAPVAALSPKAPPPPLMLGLLRSFPSHAPPFIDVLLWPALATTPEAPLFVRLLFLFPSLRQSSCSPLTSVFFLSLAFLLRS
jgi:hypothetical protein